MTRKHKLILFFVLLVILGIFWFGYLHRFSDQGIYSGKNLDNYIEAEQYKGVSLELPKDYSQQQIREKVWSYVLSQSEVKKYPAKALKQCYEKNYSYHQELAKTYGYTEFEQYLTDMFQYEEEEFSQYITDYSESEVQNQMLVYYIANKENITVTDEEVEEYWTKVLEEEGYTQDQFLRLYGETIQEYAEKKNFKFSILNSKVVDLIYQNAKLTLI